MRWIDPRLLRRSASARRVVVADAALGVLAALLVLAQSVLLARIAARAFHGAALPAVTPMLLLFVGVTAGRALAAWAFETLGRWGAAGVLSQLRRDLVDAQLNEHPEEIEPARTGAIAAAAVSGVDALETTFARYVPQVVLAVVVPVAVLALVAWIDPLSAAIMALTLPLVPVFMWLIGRATERRAHERWAALASLSTHFLDVVRGLPTLRAFNRGESQAASIRSVSERYRRTTMETLRLAFLSGAVLELAATLAIALIAVTIGIRLIDGAIGFAPALTVLVLAPELYLPLRGLAAQFHASADGLAAATTLLDAIEAPATLPDGRAIAPDPSEAPVRLEDVGFAYASSDRAVLQAVDLELAPGETVAIVGPSGAGKSTLASLLLGLERPSEGRILAGAMDLATADLAGWRRQIAWAPQHPTLFRGTVSANVRLGDEGASEERVREAARLAGADHFIRELPDGYDTTVGDGERPLSAGQRQRLSLARAFLRDASLLILDEPTANLDPDGAELVADAIARHGASRTVLLITHRLELARIADRVLEMHGGRLTVASVAGRP